MLAFNSEEMSGAIHPQANRALALMNAPASASSSLEDDETLYQISEKLASDSWTPTKDLASRMSFATENPRCNEGL